jgi:hypothetical protein
MNIFPYTSKLERGPDGIFCIDAQGRRHVWRESKCKLLSNTNQCDKRLHKTEVDAIGTLITYRNPNTGKTTWEVVFGEERWGIHDESILDRTIEKLKK